MLISATEEQFELVKRLRDLEHVRIASISNNGHDLAKIPNETGKARIIYEYHVEADGLMEEEVNLVSCKNDKVTKAAIDMRGHPIAEQQQMQALLKKNGIEGVFDPHEAGVIHIKNVRNASKLANMEKVCAGNPFMPGTYDVVEAVGLTPVLRSEEVIPLDVEALNQKTSVHSLSERLKPFYDDKRISLMDIGPKWGGKQAFEGVIDVSEYPTEIQTQLVRELRNTNPLGKAQFLPDEPGKIKMQGTLEDFGLPSDMSLEEVEKITKPFDKEWLREASKNGRTIRLSDAPNKVVLFENSLEKNVANMIHKGKLSFGEVAFQAGRKVTVNVPSEAKDVIKGYRFEFSGQQNEEIASWLKLALENRGALNNGDVLTTVNNKEIVVAGGKNANQIYKETFKSLDKYEPAPRNPKWEPLVPGAEKSAGTAAESTVKVTEEAESGLNSVLRRVNAGNAGEARTAFGAARRLGETAEAVKNVREVEKAAEGVGLFRRVKVNPLRGGRK